MPGIGGVELTGRLRRHHPELPVILTTGYGDALAPNVANVFDLLREPHSAERIAQGLRRVLGRRRERPTVRSE